MTEIDLHIAAVCVPALIALVTMKFGWDLTWSSAVLGKLATVNLLANSLLLFAEIALVFGRLGKVASALLVSDWLNSAPFVLGYGLWLSDVWATFTAVVLVMPPLLAEFSQQAEDDAELQTARSLGYGVVALISLITMGRVYYTQPVDQSGDISLFAMFSALAVVGIIGTMAFSQLGKFSATRHKRAPLLAAYIFTILTPIFAPITSGVLQFIAGYKVLRSWLGNATVETPESTSVAAFGLMFCTVALLPYCAAFSPFFPLSIVFVHEAMVLVLLTVIFGFAVINFELTSRVSLVISCCVIAVCLVGLLLSIDLFGLVQQEFAFAKLFDQPNAPIQNLLTFEYMLYGTFGVAVVGTFSFATLFFAAPILIARRRAAVYVGLAGGVSLVLFLVLVSGFSLVSVFVQAPKALQMSAKTYFELNAEIPGILDLTERMTFIFTKMVGLYLLLPLLVLMVVATPLLGTKPDVILRTLDHSPNHSLASAWQHKARSEPALRRAVWFVSGWPIKWVGWIAGLLLFGWIGIGPAALQDIFTVYSIAIGNTF